MARPNPITTKPGRKPGELVVQLPPGWDLRLRRVLRTMLDDALPDPREPGLTPQQRDAGSVCAVGLLSRRLYLRERPPDRRHRRQGDRPHGCSRHGFRSGSLREHVQKILREVSH